MGMARGRARSDTPRALERAAAPGLRAGAFPALARRYAFLPPNADSHLRASITRAGPNERRRSALEFRGRSGITASCQKRHWRDDACRPGGGGRVKTSRGGMHVEAHAKLRSWRVDDATDRRDHWRAFRQIGR